MIAKSQIDCSANHPIIRSYQNYAHTYPSKLYIGEGVLLRIKSVLVLIDISWSSERGELN